MLMVHDVHVNIYGSYLSQVVGVVSTGTLSEGLWHTMATSDLTTEPELLVLRPLNL